MKKTCGVFAVALVALGQYEDTLADVMFYLKFSVPYAMYHYGSEARIPRKRPCSALSEFATSDVPILFENCFNASSADDLLTLASGPQNLFRACDEDTADVFSYEYKKNGTIRNIDVTTKEACNMRSLKDKATRFSFWDPRVDPAYSDVHMHKFKTKKEIKHAEQTFERLFAKIPVSKFVMPLLGYYFNAGRSTVYYQHAHPENFLALGIVGDKQWLLLDPLQYAFQTPVSWFAGKAIVLTQEPNEHPYHLTQRPGDILYLPSWWMHQPIVQSGEKNLAMNIHFSKQGRLLFHLSDLFTRTFPSFRYTYSNFWNIH